MSTLRSKSNTRIVIENEEVGKSQVVLAQDLVDSTQKVLEEVSDMALVKTARIS